MSLKPETEGTIAADDKDQKAETEIDVGDWAVMYGEMGAGYWRQVRG
jgi:hypothetical protein